MPWAGWSSPFEGSSRPRLISMRIERGRRWFHIARRPLFSFKPRASGPQSPGVRVCQCSPPHGRSYQASILPRRLAMCGAIARPVLSLPVAGDADRIGVHHVCQRPGQASPTGRAVSSEQSRFRSCGTRRLFMNFPGLEVGSPGGRPFRPSFRTRLRWTRIRVPPSPCRGATDGVPAVRRGPRPSPLRKWGPGAAAGRRMEFSLEAGGCRVGEHE